MLVPQKNKKRLSWFERLFGPSGSLKISDIRKLRERSSLNGVAFVVYLRSASFIWFTSCSAKLVWVSPSESRVKRGLLISLSSLFFGWWSFEGMINTLLTLAHNLLGGFDMTDRILNPNTENGWLYWERDDLHRKFQKERFRFFLGLLAFMFLVVLPLVLGFAFNLIDAWFHELARR
jgi:hypothetical protein